MPEDREEEAHQFVFKANFQELEEKTSFKLVALHADASKPEERFYDAKDGHVIRLMPDCNMVRGSQASQTSVWPPAFTQTLQTPNPPPLRDRKSVV